MDRKNFLKSVGLAGLGLTLPVSKVFSKTETETSDCVLIPSETAGPFPLDLTENSTFFRQDVREGKAGVQLNVRLRIMGVDNCQPMQNVRVNIWHCDKDGLYSGYDNNMNSGQAGLTYLRGYQITDANGEVEFVTIFPGWYNGRICHIHFQVYVSSSYAAVSQLTFDIPAKNAIYAANSSIYTKGADPTSFSGDNIFADGYQYQLATLTPNASTGGYDTFLEVSVRGAGATSGVGHLERENDKQFTLEQNYPNPLSRATTIPFSLERASDVSIELWDLAGKKVATIDRKGLSAGKHNVDIMLDELGLRPENYVYQIVVTNRDGVYKGNKLMTVVR
ncbi:MAG: hypothetical protein KDD67_06520 [Ignavibacteriae bacterium]|nr:hypothetical protein [Ignavibacteriota bacterium]MCB9215590.1 hypothetical protein [Ignavibacteria bacterium]